ncbi:SKI/DACH domain-containing protein 1 [Cataglyphis hispanica]|uniref:SKI/DACH domain-containing protein 1 n=1 Tax=Cataglyphis hispanica TaxID=1086592 RepID=UPI00217FC476|nr:SKI/DACH domain-containing protein 1 [Cataglyphis hispanica]
MSSDMEDSTQLQSVMTDLSDHRSQHHHRHHYHHHHHRGRTPAGEIGDDECSTDSGCSSGSSTGSGKRLSRHGSGERLCRSSRSPRTHFYLERLRERTTRSQERFGSSVQRSSKRTSSPENVKSLSRGGVSPSSYSSSPSDAHSSSDSDSLKRPSTTETLRRAFQSLKFTSSKWESNKEKKHVKKSPKRILRSPVPYMYVRGLSGLPTQRVPRNSGPQ